jgi:nitrate reductase assembly molybdenum cofactor insertion protein NarJ
MDGLHATLAALRTETKSETKDHLTVFREFLAQLDQLQRHAPVKEPRVKLPARRKPGRRGRG